MTTTDTVSLMEDLSKVALAVRGVPIANMAELQTIAYEVPEHLTLPTIISSWLAGQDVQPAPLYEALDVDARAAVSSSDAALEAILGILARLRAAFPDEIAPGSA